MKVYEIFEVTASTVESMGTYSNEEYRTFRRTATRLFEKMCEMNHNLMILNGVWSVHLYDNKKHENVLSYNAEIISSNYKL